VGPGQKKIERQHQSIANFPKRKSTNIWRKCRPLAGPLASGGQGGSFRNNKKNCHWSLSFVITTKIGLALKVMFLGELRFLQYQNQKQKRADLSYHILANQKRIKKNLQNIIQCLLY
jgi:hypothetical protein